MKKQKKFFAVLLALAFVFCTMNALGGMDTAAAQKLEYVTMSDPIRQSIAAYAKTYAAHKASSSSAVLGANKNPMMPVRSSGDCATFVSSSLAYAGIPYDNRGSNQWQAGSTLSFAGAAAIGTYLKNNNGEDNGIRAKRIKSGVKITSMSKSDWSSLKAGDVVCMKISGGGGHAVVVVQEGDSMETVKLASHTRDGVYDFKFWRNAVSSMDIYRIEGYYRTPSATGSKRAIHKTGPVGQNQQIAYLKSNATGAPLTTQGYQETVSGNVAYSLRADKHYPGLDVFSKSGESVKAQSKRIIELGIAHSDDSVALFNAKLALSGDKALKNYTEAVSTTQLAVWVAQGQLNLSKYKAMDAAGTRVLNAAKTLVSKTKSAVAGQKPLKMVNASKIKLADKGKHVLAGPFTANTSQAYTVAIESYAKGSFVCNSGGNKQTVFKANEAFYLLIPSGLDAFTMGVKITSAQHVLSYSAWSAGSTQPLVLAEDSSGKRKKLSIGVAIDVGSKEVALTSAPPAIGLNPKTLTLIQGGSAQIKTALRGSAQGKQVSWKSSDNNVATVSSKGAVKAKGIGKATITASVAGVKATCALTVEAVPEGISLRINSKRAIVDGRVMTIDSNGSYPYILNGRAMVPVRFTSEKMDAKVKWTDNSKPVTISYGNCVVKLTTGSRTISVTTNGKTGKKTIDQAAVLKNGRIYVPLRAVAENLGFVVSYDNASRVIVITDTKLSSNALSARIQAAKKKL